MVEGCPSLPARNDYCACPKSGAWASREGAKRRLKKIRGRSSRRRTPQRIYQCDEGVFHLTSQPRRGEL